MSVRDPIEEAGPEPPPCEGRWTVTRDHPRYPSGYCIACGAEPHQGCAWDSKEAEAAEEQSYDYFNRYIAGDR